MVALIYSLLKGYFCAYNIVVLETLIVNISTSPVNLRGSEHLASDNYVDPTKKLVLLGSIQIVIVFFVSPSIFPQLPSLVDV